VQQHARYARLKKRGAVLLLVAYAWFSPRRLQWFTRMPELSCRHQLPMVFVSDGQLDGAESHCRSSTLNRALLEPGGFQVAWSKVLSQAARQLVSCWRSQQIHVGMQCKWDRLRPYGVIVGCHIGELWHKHAVEVSGFVVLRNSCAWVIRRRTLLPFASRVRLWHSQAPRCHADSLTAGWTWRTPEQQRQMRIPMTTMLSLGRSSRMLATSSRRHCGPRWRTGISAPWVVSCCGDIDPAGQPHDDGFL